ncbi:MAG: response regulator [Flavitalea sp.]
MHSARLGYLYMMHSVLVIEDNIEIRENTLEILELAGYKTLSAENGKLGVEAAIREIPDIIICDIMMPLLDGYGVLHLLNRNEATRKIPFIFLTAKTERSDLRKGMEMGAEDYITKPFEEIELLHAIQVRLHKKALTTQSYAPDFPGIKSFIKDVKDNGMVQQLTERYEVMGYHKKQILYQENNRCRFLFYLLTGKVKSIKNHEEGKEYITNFYAAGDFIGHLPIMEEKNYDDTAIVMEDSEIVLIPKQDFIQMMFADAAITGKFVQLITQNIREKEERLLNLAYSSLRKRVARALVDIDQKFNKNNTSKKLELSREDIARYVGTATESLIRTLSDFKSEKLINIQDGKISILAPDLLSHLLY